MDEALYYKIIDEAARHLPVCAVLFFRGESLLHERLIPFIRYAKDKGVGPLQLASNGMALQGALRDGLLSSGLDFISFSLDTNDKTLYEACRQYGDFDRAHNNVLGFLEQCAKRRAAGLAAPETQVSAVDLAVYRLGLQTFIKFWRQYADTVRVYVEHSSDGNMGSIAGGKAFKKRLPCKKPDTDMVIYWDGTAALCNHDWDTRAGIGNVRDDTMETLWSGKRYQEIRRMHESGDIEEKLACAHCDHWKMYYTEEGFLGKKYCSA
jgi:radical SAM protein with 4Fe4S-binding SPASM domain